MRFSLHKAISTDWPALAAAVFIPMSWLIWGLFPYLRSTSNGVSLWIPVSITSAAVLVLIWRLQRIRSLLTNGRSAPARITGLYISKDRGRLEFAFEHNGQLIQSRTFIHRTKAVLALQPGALVEVVFDPDRPKRAIVKHLYLA